MYTCPMHNEVTSEKAGVCPKCGMALISKKMKMDNSTHYEESVLVNATPDDLFAFADNHSNFSSHMNKSNMMMGGGKMNTELDSGQGRVVGSHIKMGGRILGINLFLDEVVTERTPPTRKVWKTVGTPKLLVIDTYELGFEIARENDKSRFKVFINYDLPESGISKLLGFLLGRTYAKWCVHQMIQSVDTLKKNGGDI